jgi:hypothetical protein
MEEELWKWNKVIQLIVIFNRIYEKIEQKHKDYISPSYSIIKVLDKD